MRPRFVIFLLVAVAVILVIAFWLRPVQPPVDPEEPQQVAQSSNTTPANTRDSQANTTAAASDAISSSTNLTIIESPLHKQLQTPEGFKRYVEDHNKQMEFYGRFIDQYSNPVPGVKVKMGTRHWTMPDPTVLQAGSKDISFERTSDADGRFEVSGGTGDGLGIYVNKQDGYTLSPKAPGDFAAQTGSFENPVIFKMWKMSEPQTLVVHRTLFGFQRDGRIYTLDLLNGKKIEGENADGDLRIKFQCPSIQPNQPYSWTLEMSAVGGGLIETADEFTYLAPESGYQPQILLRASSVAPSSVPDFTKNYYITSRNGQYYGVVHLQIYSDYRGQSAILVESSINPNASRNLQP